MQFDNTVYELKYPLGDKKTLDFGVLLRSAQKRASKKEYALEQTGLMIQACTGLSDEELLALSGPDFYALNALLSKQVTHKSESYNGADVELVFAISKSDEDLNEIKKVSPGSISFKDLVESEKLEKQSDYSPEDYQIAKFYGLELQQVDRLSYVDHRRLIAIYDDFLDSAA